MHSSYIVCTLNRPGDLRRLISSIARQSVLPDELIVVDASDPQIGECNGRLLEEILAPTGIRLQHLAGAVASLPWQRNRGIDRASGDLLFFIDDDVVLGRDFHEKMVALHRSYQAEGVVGIQPTVNTTSASFSRRLFRVVFHPELRTRRALQIIHLSGDPYARPRAQGEEVSAAEWLSGACMSFAKGVFRHFRFDESLRGYAFLEDVDFSYRVSRRFRLIRAETVTVCHTLSRVARLDARQLAEMRMLNRHYLFRKNIPQTLIRRLAYLWATVGQVIRAGILAMTSGEIAVLIGTVGGLTRILRGAAPTVSHLPDAPQHAR